jgi:hypothetical protein
LVLTKVREAGEPKTYFWMTQRCRVVIYAWYSLLDVHLCMLQSTIKMTIPDIIAAATAVFNTYELLEQILTYLTPEEVTAKTWTAKLWHNIADESRFLQPRAIAPRGPLDKTAP